MTDRANFQPPPGFTQEEFEKLLEDHIASAMFDAIVSYLKTTADLMDNAGLEYLKAEDLRRIALEMAFTGYEAP
jgi:hypothetical protein